MISSTHSDRMADTAPATASRSSPSLPAVTTAASLTSAAVSASSTGTVGSAAASSIIVCRGLTAIRRGTSRAKPTGVVARVVPSRVDRPNLANDLAARALDSRSSEIGETRRQALGERSEKLEEAEHGGILGALGTVLHLQRERKASVRNAHRV